MQKNAIKMILAGLGFGLLLIALAWFGFGRGGKSGETVPDFTGMTQADITADETYSHFSLSYEEVRNGANVGDGVIYGQSVAAGEKAQADTVIVLQVNRVVNTTAMATLTGGRLAAAQTYLDTYSMSATITYELTQDVAKSGTVSKQDPAPYTQVPATGAMVYLTVLTTDSTLNGRVETYTPAGAPTPAPVVPTPVPDAAATPAPEVTPAPDAAATPAPDATATPDSELIIEEDGLEVPNVLGKSYDEACKIFKEAGFGWIYYSHDEETTGKTAETVLSQSPAAGSKVAGDTHMELVLAR